MFTEENATKIIENLGKLDLVVTYNRPRGYGIQVLKKGQSQPIIYSREHSIKNKKEAILTICATLKWAERTYKEFKKDKTKKRLIKILIPQILNAFSLDVCEVSTSRFKF